MGFLSKDSSFNVPYSADDCFEAMKIAASLTSKFKIKNENRLAGTMEISVSAGMTSLTFGDIISVSISKSGNGESSIAITSTAKVPSALASVQQSKNIQTLTDAFTHEIGYFKQVSAEAHAPVMSDAPKDRLRTLEGLLSDGLISAEEYEKKRSDILAAL